MDLYLYQAEQYSFAEPATALPGDAPNSYAQHEEVGPYAISEGTHLSHFLSAHNPMTQTMDTFHAVDRPSPEAPPLHDWDSLRDVPDVAITSMGAADVGFNGFDYSMDVSNPSGSHTLVDEEGAPYTVASAAPSVAHGHAAVKCAWAACERAVPGATLRDIRAHLQKHHIIGGVSSWRGRCQWAGCKCGKELQYDSLPKHILTVHVGATAQHCGWCNKKFSRADAVKRHMKNGVCRKTGHMSTA